MSLSEIEATVVVFAYDERPTLGLMRSLIRDARRYPSVAIWDQSKDGLIPRTRSMAASRFLEQGHGDVLVMIDHDIEWGDGDLPYIIQAAAQEKAVVGGIYSQRQFGRGVAVRFDMGTPPMVVGREGIAEVDYVGTGFMAIHRDVLERLRGYCRRTRHGYYRFFPLEEVYEDGAIEELSEDYAFCRLVKQAGARVFAALKPTLVHHGTWAYRVSDASYVPPPPSDVTLYAIDPDAPVEVRWDSVGPMRFTIDPDDRFVSAALRSGKMWEAEVLREIESHVTATRHRHSGQEVVLVDVGAYIGCHTVPAAKWAHRVIAVEPLYVERLRKNLELNECENVEVVPAAVGAVAGQGRMLCDYSNPGAARLASYGQEVAVTTLAEVLPKRGPVVLKMDIEGAEHLALLGAGSLKNVEVIIFEYSEAQLAEVSGVTADQLFKKLTALGFGDFRYAATETAATIANLPKGRAYCNIVGKRLRRKTAARSKGARK